MNFAKVFGESDNQIAVIIKENHETEQAEVSVFFKPKGFGVCQANFGYPTTDEGWVAAEKFFNDFTEDKGLDIKRGVEKEMSL